MSKKKNKVKNNVEPVVENQSPPIDKYATVLDFKWKGIISLCFLLFSLVLYYQCLNYGYVLDDKIVLSENTFTKKGFSGIPELFSTDSFQGYFGEQKDLVQGGRYRPLSLVTFAIEYQFFGLNSSLSHIINVILYGLSGIICFFTLRLLFQEKSKAFKTFFSFSFLVSLLFLSHPIHTEAVANIKGRDEIMSFIFSMAALFYAIKYFDTKKILWLLLMIFAFVLGFFSKENTVTFLAVIPLSLLLFRQEKSNRNQKEGIFSFFKGMANKQNLIVVVSLLLSTVFYLVIRYNVMGFLMNSNPSTDIMNNPFYGMNEGQKMATICYTLFVYLKLSFVPIELTHDYYPYHIPISSFSDPIVLISCVLNLLLIALMVYNFNKNKMIAYGIGFYFICLSIVSNIVVDVGTFMNERFIFTASLGLCILMIALIKWMVSFLKKDSKSWMPLVILAPIVLLYSFKTIDRVPAWENALSLNKSAIKISKNSARSNSFMATALFNEYKETTDQTRKQSLLKEAEPYANKAVEIYPDYLNGHLMRAGIAAEKYRYDRDQNKLLNTFKSIMYKRPDLNYLTEYLKYLNGRSTDQNALLAFYKEVGGQILIKETKRYSWAVHYLQIALEIAPNDPQIRGYLVEALTAMGRPNDAAKYK